MGKLIEQLKKQIEADKELREDLLAILKSDGQHYIDLAGDDAYVYPKDKLTKEVADNEEYIKSISDDYERARKEKRNLESELLELQASYKDCKDKCDQLAQDNERLLSEINELLAKRNK